MKLESSKRFAIFGLPGSGKSTFADKLGKELNFPVHHLDRHYFVAKWKIRNRSEFIAAQRKMVFKRPFFHDKSIVDIAKGCSKSHIGWSLLKYLWTFNKEKKAGLEELRKKYPSVHFRMFKSPQDADHFLNELKKAYGKN